MSPQLPVRLLATLGLVTVACGSPQRHTPTSKDRDEPRPPVAERRPHDVVAEHGTRNDPYYWLRDDTRKDPDVLAYLEAENAYTKAMLAPSKAIEDTLYDEFIARLQEDDSSYPVEHDGYWYYTRYEAKKQHPIYCRRKGTMDAPEQVMLDGNQLGEGEAFYKIGGMSVSPDGTRIAYAEDRVGRNQYRLRVRDLTTGELLADDATNISPAIAWANDSKTLFIVGKDETTLRERYIYRHELGTSGQDVLVHDETDGAFSVGVGRSKSDRYVVIGLSSTAATEYRLIDADKPASTPVVFMARERDHEYEIQHLNGRFVISTNWKATNFRLMEVSDRGSTDRSAWKELLPHRDDALVSAFGLFDDALLVSERSGGLRRVRVIPKQGEPFVIPADEPTFTMSFVDTPEPAATAIRFTYTSLTTPSSLYELDLKTGEQRLLKRQPVLGDFDPAHYVTEYLHAKAADGTSLPISLVRQKDTKVDGTAPILVGGYGSYGSSRDPSFSANALSLLDRGWVIAIAHIRGGQEMGRKWYEDGRRLHKKNTFTDFNDITEHLVKTGYGARDKVFAQGGSAGGLLMGAIINMRPDLYRGVIAKVPFVDVVTTMLDESIPLTTGEFDEWGNPKNKESYDYMLSYSPYDNVTAQAYPSMLVTTGLWDSQVQYFEPAKWVAKLRATKTDDNLLLLTTDMTAGHGGKSGRYEAYREVARDYAFLLHVLERPDSRAR